MSTIAFTSKMGGEWYDIQFRYDPDLVTMIKTVIPSGFRKYDPGTHTWSAAKMWAQAFAQAARHAGHITAGIPDPGQYAPGTGPSSSNPFAGTSSAGGSPYASSGVGGAGFFSSPPFTAGGGAYTPPPRQKRSQPPPMPPKPPQLTENWARELMRRTPPELREKLYKNLAKVLHEDLGGDGRLMQELNDARNGLAS